MFIPCWHENLPRYLLSSSMVWCTVSRDWTWKTTSKTLWLSWAIHKAFIRSILTSTQISKLRTVESERVQRLSGIWIHFWINTVTKWNSPNTAIAVCSHLWETPLISYWNVCNPCIIYMLNLRNCILQDCKTFTSAYFVWEVDWMVSIFHQYLRGISFHTHES